MLMSDSYLFDVGWFFFAAWTVIVVVISLAAFGKDLLPSQAALEPLQSTRQSKRPTRSVLP
jgi:hypothetical protein